MDNRSYIVDTGGLLLVLFIALKLLGLIGWSWWWVLSPLWLPFAFAAFLVLLALVISMLER